MRHALACATSRTSSTRPAPNQQQSLRLRRGFELPSAPSSRFAPPDIRAGAFADVVTAILTMRCTANSLMMFCPRCWNVRASLSGRDLRIVLRKPGRKIQNKLPLYVAYQTMRRCHAGGASSVED